MKMMDEKLKEILDKHTKWLNKEEDGECANLSYADLNGSNLGHANLRHANLICANLGYANLYDADLQYANLNSANLFSSDLRYANLSGAKLGEANLFGANLLSADLRGVKLYRANLSYANLKYANLLGSNLSATNLLGAILDDAGLHDTSLRGANLTQATYTNTVLNLQCPEEGSFIAWKKLAGNKIAKLLIPEDAKRSSATTRKCRASKASVLAIYNNKGDKEFSEGISNHDIGFIYRVGETVYADLWDEDRWVECSGGIHFFTTRKEAEEY